MGCFKKGGYLLLLLQLTFSNVIFYIVSGGSCFAYLHHKQVSII